MSHHETDPTLRHVTRGLRRSILGVLVLACIAAMPFAAVAPVAAGGTPRVAPLSPTADWLTTLNYYRTGSGLQPVTVDPRWLAGQQHHIAYLVNTPASLRVGPYVSMHTENPASAWYTPDGDLEASRSNIGGSVPNGHDAIENLLQAPFHSMAMMQRNLRKVAFTQTAAFYMLDVGAGLGPTTVTPTNVFFPGNGTTTYLSNFDGESADPREGCGPDSPTYVGLPVYAMLPVTPAIGTSARFTRPDGTTVSAPRDVCVLTAATFHTTDAVYGQGARGQLIISKAVVVIPRRTLQAGLHKVTIRQPGRADVSWSFTVLPMNDRAHSIVATPGVTTVSLSWLPPTATGGAPVTNYAVFYRKVTDTRWTFVRDGYTSSPSFVVTGLENGIAYQFLIDSSWGGQWQTWSKPSDYAVPRTRPSTPVAPGVRPADRSVVLTWKAPYDGGAAIGDYVVQYALRTGTVFGPWITFADGVRGSTGATVTGLLNGKSYTFRLAAKNAAGLSGYSPRSAIATPRTLPTIVGAPTIAALVGGVSLAWAVPGNGGSPITSYRVQCSSNAGTSWTTTNVAAPAHAATVTGIAKGLHETCRLAAKNAAGYGRNSAWSATVLVR